MPSAPQGLPPYGRHCENLKSKEKEMKSNLPLLGETYARNVCAACSCNSMELMSFERPTVAQLENFVTFYGT
jgi:hypothetical protein